MQPAIWLGLDCVSPVNHVHVPPPRLTLATAKALVTCKGKGLFPAFGSQTLEQPAEIDFPHTVGVPQRAWMRIVQAATLIRD